MDMSNCRFQEGCNQIGDVYEHAYDCAQLWLGVAVPNSPEQLKADLSEKDAQLQELAFRNAELLHGPLQNIIFARFVAVGDVESDCHGCPIRKICYGIVKENPPIDPTTGEPFRFE